MAIKMPTVAALDWTIMVKMIPTITPSAGLSAKRETNSTNTGLLRRGDAAALSTFMPSISRPKPSRI